MTKIEQAGRELADAVAFACHKLELGRIWGGQAWHYNMAHPTIYRPAYERLAEALAAYHAAEKETGG